MPGIDRTDPHAPKPQVHIKYWAPVGAGREFELPFVVGVLGNFSGNPGEPLRLLAERKFLDIDRRNFNDILARIGPELNIRVKNSSTENGAELAVRLAFRSLDDFHPGKVAEQVPALKTLLDTGNLSDGLLSRQVAAIMHHPEFLALEGSWRGLHYLAMNSETGPLLKIRVLNVSKSELVDDFATAESFDRTSIFKLIHVNEFALVGGEPFGALIGDYEFSHGPEDIALLTTMSHVAAVSFAPFITAAGAGMFGLAHMRELNVPRDLVFLFQLPQYFWWRNFRDSPHSAYVVLTLPRVLARVPYGAASEPVEEFAFEKAPKDAQCATEPLGEEECCWMNSAYLLGARLTEAFANYGWCTRIRGHQSGGVVENLPVHTFVDYDSVGDDLQQRPTEVTISHRRDFELSKCGFSPLLHYRTTDRAVFISAQTVLKPRIFDRPDVTANEAIAARLPCVMAISRFAHYIKVMAFVRIGAFRDVETYERWFQGWIDGYVSPAGTATQEINARFPLRDARIEVREIPGEPGWYNVIADLRPWFQMETEELSNPRRLVIRIRAG